jgi:hypothetical protein
MDTEEVHSWCAHTHKHAQTVAMEEIANEKKRRRKGRISYSEQDTPELGYMSIG